METELLKGLVRIELPNSLQIWYRRLPGTDFISVRLMIMAGSAHQSLRDLGLAHFVEHLVFNFRNKSNSTKQIHDEIIQSGGYINAVTGLDSTVFFMDIPSSKFEKCLELIECHLIDPDFSNRAINNEKQIILNELQIEPYDFWYNIFYRKVLGNYAFAYSGIGTEKTIKNISKEKIEAFFEKNYVLNKMVLICVGDVDVDKIKDQVIEKLGRFKNKKENKESYVCPEIKKGLIRITEPAGMDLIVYGYKVCGYSGLNKDYYALWFLQNYLKKILFDFVREKGVLYAIDVIYHSFDLAGLFYIYASSIKKGRRAIINRIKLEINSIKNSVFDTSEFNKYQDLTINQFLAIIKDSKKLADYYVSLAVNCGRDQELKDPIEELRSLTPQDIKQIANKYFIRERSFFMVKGTVEAIGIIIGSLITLGFSFFGIMIIYLAIFEFGKDLFMSFIVSGFGIAIFLLGLYFTISLIKRFTD